MLERYSSKDMREIWSLRRKYETWIKVEIAYLQALSEAGKVPVEAFEAIRDNVKTDPDRIARIEEETQHDLDACMEDARLSLDEAGLGQYRNLIHAFGLTSYDTEDPALVLIMNDAFIRILTAVDRLEAALSNKAREHKWTLMIGNTHGRHAEPTTLGHFFLVQVEAVRRSRTRILDVMKNELRAAKMSGAIGNYTGMDPRIADRALKILCLEPAKVETQITQRDRIATALYTLAVTAGTMEQIARMYWEQMRSEVCGLQEYRKPRQRGSSVMAYKVNPITMEQIQGLARVMREYAQVACANISTPDFRAIEQSGPERIILPDATSLIEYMANKLAFHVENLVVFPDRLRANFDDAQGVWALQEVRQALMDAGVSHEEAYRFAQECGFECASQRRRLYDVLKEKVLPGTHRFAHECIFEELYESFFDPWRRIKDGINELFDRAGLTDTPREPPTV